MPNTTAVGVAYSDPQFDSLTVTGTATFNGAVVGAGAVTGTSVTTTTASGVQLTFGNGQTFSALSTAITVNVTTTSQPSGSIGITSNATGVGKLFMSDGTKWQYAVVA